MSESVIDLIHRRINRRELLSSGTIAVGVAGCSTPIKKLITPEKKAFQFTNLAPTMDDQHHLSPGYELRLLLAWGDPLFEGMEPFNPHTLTGEEQAKRMGYNNDYIAFGLVDSKSAWLVVNNEATNASLMFRDEKGYSAKKIKNIEIEMAAHGLTIVGLKKNDWGWELDLQSNLNRRITANSPMKIGGPAAGSPKMKTPESPHGLQSKGTVHNCSGGVTPWGTVLSCEENILYYFYGDATSSTQAKAFKRYGIGRTNGYRWDKIQDRFHLQRVENEPNRFGWVIEFDPRDPNSIPIKRTALGRFNHESANPVLSFDNRVVVYMGDDGSFEYLYRFVSDAPYDQSGNNVDVLDKGVLSVAQFKENGLLTWIPLIHGQGLLTKENGFESQADVLINVRLAADLVKATPMDRVEDVEPHPDNGFVFVNLTGNNKRGTAGYPGVDGANPRAENKNGHILTIKAPSVGQGFNHASVNMHWDVLILAGDSTKVENATLYDRNNDSPANFARPDNAAIDPQGRLWITTDGSQGSMGICDGLYAVEYVGLNRGKAKRLFTCPLGAEVTGPCFSPDGKTLFLSVQHPGYSSNATFDNPACRWPDYESTMPPRPAVVQIKKIKSGIIGD